MRRPSIRSGSGCRRRTSSMPPSPTSGRRCRATLEIDADGLSEIQVDPRLTSTALAHVLENAGAVFTERSGDRGARVDGGRRRSFPGAGPRARARRIGPGSPIRAVLSRPEDETRHRHQDWGSRSPAGCWRPKAAGSGARTCLTAAHSSRSWSHHPSASLDAQAHVAMPSRG